MAPSFKQLGTWSDRGIGGVRFGLLHAVSLVLCGSMLLAACSPPADPPKAVEPVEEAALESPGVEAEAEAGEAEVESVDAQDPAMDEGDVGAPELSLTSNAFTAGEAIPDIYSCDGEDVSPPVSWSGIPEDTETLALILEDPDAPGGTWIHWVLYNLPADAQGLDAGAETDLPGGTLTGENSWGVSDYGGPCPPGGTHHYFFYLFALDTALELGAGASSADLRSAMVDHVLAEAELMGIYSR